MSYLRNKVQLIGRLGKDPEVRDLDGGKKVVSFSLATSEYYNDKDGKKVENTQWHNVVAWGKTAELAEQLLKKGMEVLVDGRLNNRSYEDKEGKRHYITEVVMNEMLLLEKKK